MPKIVKSDLFQLIICKDDSEVLCNEVWSYKLAQLIHINVVQILPAIRAATYPPIGFLLRFHTKQQLLKRFYQRQRAMTGLCFRPLLVNHSYLTVQHDFCDGVLDCEGFAFKIDRVPFYADDLTTAQTVECAKGDGKLDTLAFDDGKQIFQLLFVVGGSYIFVLLWSFYSICWIEVDQAELQCVLERLSYVGVTMNHSIGAYLLHIQAIQIDIFKST